MLDGTSLEVLATFDLIGNWILSISLYRSDQKDVDHIVLVDADGIVHKMKIDMNTVSHSKERRPFALETSFTEKTIDICVNPFDQKIFFILDSACCTILTDEFEILLKIPKQNSDFQSAKFLSGRTLLLSDCLGKAYFYYLGPHSDVKFQPCVNLNPRNIVLLSDRKYAIYVEQMSIGPYSLYR